MQFAQGSRIGACYNICYKTDFLSAVFAYPLKCCFAVFKHTFQLLWYVGMFRHKIGIKEIFIHNNT